MPPKKLIVTLTFALIIVSTCNVVAQTKFTGAWGFLKPQTSGGQSFFTVLRTFNEQGSYTQIRVASNGSFIWQIARIEIIDDNNLKETIDYCANPANTGKTFTYQYKLTEDANKNKLLVIQASKKTEDGVGKVDWREVWKLQKPVNN